MKPLVAVYFADPDPMGAPFNKHGGSYMRGYLELGRRVEEEGGRYCFVRGKETFRGAGVFSRCFWPQPDGSMREGTEAVAADVVFNKDEDLAFDDGTVVVNEPSFHAFCNDKPATYRRFAEFSPVSAAAASPSALKAAMDAVPGDVIVAKPAWGSGSAGVVIGTRAQVLAAAHDRYPLVIQQCIDTSNGIPGVCSTRHDLRVILVGGDVALVAVKTPAPGNLVYGLSHGGSFTVLDDALVPRDALDVAKRIDRAFTDVPSRYYSIDLARDRDGRWYLIELNSPAGMNEEAEHRNVAREHGMAARMLLRAARRT